MKNKELAAAKRGRTVLEKLPAPQSPQPRSVVLVGWTFTNSPGEHVVQV
jgi:hypothetical protein